MFERGLIIAVAFLPAVAVLAHALAKTQGHWRSEPLWTAFFLGMVGAIGAGAAVFLLNQFAMPKGEWPALARAFFNAALPEEFVKWCVLVFVAIRHVDARDPRDPILLGAAVAMGFAALENVLYLFATDQWKPLSLARSLTAVPSHGTFGLVMGALVVGAQIDSARRRQWLLASIAAPVAMHTAYDAPLMCVKNELSDGLARAWLEILIVNGCFAIILTSKMLAKVMPTATVGAERRWSVLLGGIGIVAMTLILLAAAPWDHPFIVLAVSALPLIFGWDLVRIGWARRCPRFPLTPQ